MPNCTLCGEPMPEGETMFKYHGYSGPCPKPPLPRPQQRDGERWIADLAALVLSERQPDGSYKDAYRLAPLDGADAAR